MPGGVVFPLRMSIVRQQEGLWLHSPVALDDAVVATIDALGPVKHLVVPSQMHDRHIAAAQARWPQATCWAPPGWQRSGVRVDRSLADAAWPDIGAYPIHGAPRVDEWVFHHRPTRSLLVTDLVFHVTEPANWQTSTLLWAVGCAGEMRASRSWRWVFRSDATALAASLEAVLALPVDRVVPCHGAIGPGDALRGALAGLV